MIMLNIIQITYLLSTQLNDIIESMPLQPRLLETALGYTRIMDRFAEEYPEHYLFPFVNGRNLLCALEKEEVNLFAHRDFSGESYFEARKNMVNESYERAKEYLDRAARLFEGYLEEHENKDLRIERTNIQNYLAMWYRQSAFLKARSLPSPFMAQIGELIDDDEPDIEKVKEAVTSDVVMEITSLAAQSVSICKSMFENEVFQSDASAYVTLSLLANSLKIFLSPGNIELGLKYYETAIGCLGPNSNLIEGLGFYRDAQAAYERNGEEQLQLSLAKHLFQGRPMA